MKLERISIDGASYFLRREEGRTLVAKCATFPQVENQLEVGEFCEREGPFEPDTVVSPSKVVCVGRNYADHAKELGNHTPSYPLLFLKAPSAIIGNKESIKLPSQSNQVEHEGELAIVIGRTLSQLSDDADPFEYVFGYTCLNDVTARDLQKADGQFMRAKSFDTFCPIGPLINTDLDVSDLLVEVRVNGEIRQTGRTSQMVFDIPYLLRYISKQMTLLPGDIIATGTPAGVSKLNPGDLCEVHIEGIGTLQNLIEN